jgi:transcriptional regulator with XRE-family HTH domain
MIMLDQSAQHLLNAEHFWERLKETADRFCDGQIKPFEKILGFSEGTFSNWKLGRHKPSFPAFYRLTRSLGTTPVAFLTNGAIKTFSPHGIAPKPGKTRRAHLKRPEKDQISKELHAIIDQGCSELPMREVADRIGYAHSYLIYWFPEPCRQISQLHRNWVSEQVERQAGERGDLTVATVRKLYAGHLRVTRGLVHTELRKLGLSLKDPVVRDAFYDVRAEQMALRGEPTEAE